jgi:hypothetical protein
MHHDEYTASFHTKAAAATPAELGKVGIGCTKISSAKPRPRLLKSQTNSARVWFMVRLNEDV